MQNIFEYDDFRRYLQDFYAQEKARNSAFSLRYFALKAGIPVSTSSLFVSVIKGRRRLSADYVHRFIKGLRLKGKEAEYFEHLVHFNQAKRVSEKARLYEKLLSCRRPSSYRLGSDQYEFFSKWYHCAVWNLLGFCKQQKGAVDYDALARWLHPAIQQYQARQSVDLLERMGLIAPDSNGFYARKQSTLTTGDEVRSVQVASFQVETMKLAMESIDRCAPETRDISTLTIGISAEGFGKIKERIRNFRKELLDIAVVDKGEDRVYQCNFQIFPMTKPVEGK